MSNENKPAAAQEAVDVWTVTREGDATFPRTYFSEAAADAMVAHVTLPPFAVKHAPVAAAQDRMAIRMLVAAGFVTEDKANEALQIAHGFADGPITPEAPGIDLEQFKDLIGFAAWSAINLPETDPRRDFIRQANELLAITASPEGESMHDWSLRMAKLEEGQHVGAGAHGLPDSPKGGSDERARFESWASKRWGVEKGMWGGEILYHSSKTQIAWDAWQAAMQATSAEVGVSE